MDKQNILNFISNHGGIVDHEKNLVYFSEGELQKIKGEIISLSETRQKNEFKFNNRDKQVSKEIDDIIYCYTQSENALLKEIERLKKEKNEMIGQIRNCRDSKESYEREKKEIIEKLKFEISQTKILTQILSDNSKKEQEKSLSIDSLSEEKSYLLQKLNSYLEIKKNKEAKMKENKCVREEFNKKSDDELELKKNIEYYTKEVNKWKCPLCHYERDSNILYGDCGHLGCCSECLKNLNRKDKKGAGISGVCPRCKKLNKDCYQVFIPK